MIQLCVLFPGSAVGTRHSDRTTKGWYVGTTLAVCGGSGIVVARGVLHANCKSVIAPVLAASDQELSTLRVRILLFIAGKKRSALSGDSDDDGEANTYDYNDSFIDDQDLHGNAMN